MKKNYDSILSEDDKKNIINDYSENLMSLREVAQKYDIKSKYYLSKLLKEHMRNLSDANKLAHKKYPNSFKHSDNTKEKIRVKRFQYMKDHPEKTAWRKKNMSYPEKCFILFLEERGYDKNFRIEREYPIFPYFIDFAFVDLKIAIEIDGSQHLSPNRKKSDCAKDAILVEKGWKVIRIAESIVKTDWDLIDSKLKDYITFNTDIVFEQVGIVKHCKQYTKVQRNEFGRSIKMTESFIQQRHVNRPDLKTLKKELEESNFKQVAKKYGVSDNAVRKWCKFYGMSQKASDYKQKKVK